MRILKQPIKVIDNFLESPHLWRDFALEQTYNKVEMPTDSGVQTVELNILNMNLFSSLARNFISHIHDRSMFKFLKINFISTDESYNFGWIKQADTNFNVIGLIFLNTDEEKNGIEFFHQVRELNHNYEHLFLNEYNSENKLEFLNLKKEQREYFRKNMSVKSMFNRCVMFHPSVWHSDGDYFGKSIDDSRLVIKFYGIVE